MNDTGENGLRLYFLSTETTGRSYGEETAEHSEKSREKKSGSNLIYVQKTRISTKHNDGGTFITVFL